MSQSPRTESCEGSFFTQIHKAIQGTEQPISAGKVYLSRGLKPILVSHLEQRNEAV
ncbi:hypothetical protein RISK_005048 [Rhodopirellula islandica]|uniref:Uncharacterized protein n=1 Tax=Rhodopirellula islandica TaxID=595434 RepID=A0A0J1B7P6_RHOIS|nr:hypothetical protein RISK_005048 [Rhodopirellula islandica]